MFQLGQVGCDWPPAGSGLSLLVGVACCLPLQKALCACCLGFGSVRGLWVHVVERGASKSSNNVPAIL